MSASYFAKGARVYGIPRKVPTGPLLWPFRKPLPCLDVLRHRGYAAFIVCRDAGCERAVWWLLGYSAPRIVL